MIIIGTCVYVLIYSALEQLIGDDVIITDVRVEQTDDGSVDTTG